ncbi:MAG: cohesin domain-containing protein [Bacteroidetes bacterium]|nr:cohesin domain-containing protein [Bacteroidota bacterium]
MKTLILKILPLVLMMIWAGSGFAQITTTAGTVTSCPGDIVVPVNVTNCNGIGAISLILNYDNTKLTYLGYQNLNNSLTVGLLIINSTGNKVVISWANTTAANLGSSTLVELRFNSVPGTTTLSWDTQTAGNCEYSDINGNILPATFTNGTATINQPPVINTQPVDKTVLVGQNTSFSVSASGAGIAYLWQISTNGGGLWTDLINNATYSNVTGSTLYLTNALITYNGYKYRCRLTGTCAPVVYTNEVTLSVIYPVTTILPTASFCPGNIIVPVTVTNFTGVAAFSLTFSYNSSCLTYNGYQTLNGALSGGTFVANASGGKIYMTWSSTTAATFGNGTLVELLFSAGTGSSPLVWDIATEGNCEYSTLSGSLITSVFTNGNETIYGLPAVTSDPANKIIAKGQNTSFSVTASGSGLSYLWQVSTNGGASFTDLVNGGYYSNVTTSTLTITAAQLAISGYQYRCRVSGNCLPVVFSNPAVLTVLPNVITTCGNITGCPGQIIVPINVTDFIGVAAFSLTLNFNPAILAYTGYQNLNASVSGGIFTANASAGSVYLTWSNITAATIANGGLLTELKFAGVPGASTLIWDTQTTGNCEYSDVSGQVIFSTWTNGNATINTPPAITTDPLNRTIYASGSTSFSVSGTGTGLGYLWQVSTNGGTIWSNLSNVSPYSGAGSNTLTINPASTGMNGYFYRCIVSGTCTPSATSDSALLTVTQAAISTTPGTITNSCTGNVNIPVNVTNCSNVGSISLTMVFDTTKMTFEGYHSVNAALSGGLLVVNRSGNQVIMSWAGTTTINIGAGVLVQYRFKANAGISTTLTWDTQTPGACEYADPLGTIITSLYNTSTIGIQANALIVNAGPDVVMSGSQVQLNGDATGGTTPYTWLWSPAGSLSNPAIPNPLASPAVTTTYTLTVTTNNACVGSDVMNVVVNGPPQDLSLQDITIPGGTSNCYNALQTITVAGGLTTFIVQNGGSAIMIAGQKISYLPGTKVNPGGYMHGYITTNGQYCNGLPAAMVATATGESLPAVPVDGSMFRIYPNPTPGKFTIELEPGDLSGNTYVTVYGTCGELILGDDMTNEVHREVSLAGKPDGLYFVRIVSGNKGYTEKILKY